MRKLSWLLTFWVACGGGTETALDSLSGDLSGDTASGDTLSSDDLGLPDDVPEVPDPGVTAAVMSGPGFWDAPWPSDARGVADIERFPNPDGATYVQTLIDMVAAADGFSETGGVFFRFDGVLGGLPSLAESALAASPLLLVDLTSGARVPLRASFNAKASSRFGAKNQLALVPLQGRPLTPATRHAAIVRTSLKDANGLPLRRAPQDALDLDVLAALGIEPNEVAAMTVFTTGDSGAVLRALTLAAPPVTLVEAPEPTGEVYDGFCVLEGRVEFPRFQHGELPYAETGGQFVLAADGAAVQNGTETARIFLTIPIAPAGPKGYPVAVFSRTGGGGDRPLIDRGIRAKAHGESVPGTGPARELAAVGIAGVMVDGPHGGLRNVTSGDEQFLMFNALNPWALRDNVRQSALELALLPALLDTLAVNGCGGQPAALDADRLALMGHSMGATIGPITLAISKRYGAGVFSGAGSSYLENVMWKISPTPVRPALEALLGVSADGGRLVHGDPVMSLLQWAGEPSDPPIHGAATRDRHVLVVQGIVDTYILPPIAAATQLSMGLPLAGPDLGDGHPELAAFDTYASLTALLALTPVTLPYAPAAGPTRAVVHHLEDGIEDGHEVFFQLEAPKAQYRRFLQSWAAGEVPEIPSL